VNALAAIHVARKQLGLDEETYRAVLVRVTGKDSAGAMDEAERRRVVDELRRQGFKPAKSALEGPFAKKLQALWIAAWNLGLVRDRRDAAMLAFVKRQTGIEHTRFLRETADARKAIEALKAWIARDAGVDGKLRPDHDFLRHECGNIAWAQYRRLVPGATLVGNAAMFRHEAMLAAGARPDAPLGLLGDADWRRIMNVFGERIRKAAP
jgi:hypothetical protein